MQTTQRLFALFALVVAALGYMMWPKGEDYGPALARFQAFQEALLRGDKPALSRLVASNGLEAVAAIPKLSEGRAKLEVQSHSFDRGQLVVEVVDPSKRDASRRGSYVLVREDGLWKVDLVATAGRNHRETAAGGAGQRLVQKKMSPRERAMAAKAIEARFRRDRAATTRRGR